MSEEIKKRWGEACKKTGYTPIPPRPASLVLDGQVFSTGLVLLDQPDSKYGSFQPQDGKTLDTPIRGVALLLLDTRETIVLADASPCPTGSQSHFHLHLA
jgi:hypothetical protein